MPLAKSYRQFFKLGQLSVSVPDFQSFANVDGTSFSRRMGCRGNGYEFDLVEDALQALSTIVQNDQAVAGVAAWSQIYQVCGRLGQAGVHTAGRTVDSAGGAVVLREDSAVGALGFRNAFQATTTSLTISLHSELVGVMLGQDCTTWLCSLRGTLIGSFS